MEENKIVNEEVDVKIPEKRDYVEELLLIIRSNNSNQEIKEKLSEYHDNDIAEVIPSLTQVKDINFIKL